ncbi:undecaprenyl-diphosphate phosphatase [Prochlorococcus sp. MIT 1307]|uniref:undecaprenyl-diphosphate phosphatase n=1 Tax=Prochlorococcus sp. MIT 1307 TaxID=3096219 RepID=UPI002A761D3E|nr:undecaprenyl-diphosphate phosphatase [Prochlorococcus sp. MIT 1307]
MPEIANNNELLEACFKYLILGMVQGLTEFLPISSTAHLKVVPMMLGWTDPGLSITAVIQLGSILAVITYFRNDLKEVLKGISLACTNDQWREKKARLGIAICTGTLPILLTGMSIKLFWSDFENSLFRSIPFIALISIFMAFLLAIAEKLGDQSKQLEKISGQDGLVIGIGQIFSIIPGVSRSGITLTTALLHGWKREDAARFSFLIGIPAISLAGAAELKNTFHAIQLTNEFLPLIIGISSATVVSWIVIDWLLKYLQKNSTWIFVIYRLIFGITLLLRWWVIRSS